MLCRLCLKSATESSVSKSAAPQLTPNTKSAEHVHLCSEELAKAWSVRQVSTSNEVYVAQALGVGQEVVGTGDTDMANAGHHAVILTGIAKADSVLELLPATVDVEAHLRRLLPVYDQDELMRLFERGDELPQYDHEKEDEYRSVASEIPAPDTSIRNVWQQLCVSCCPASSVAPGKEFFIPTTQLLQTAWNSALAAFNIRTSGRGVMQRVDFEDNGEGANELWPVKAALWRRLCSNDGSSLDSTKVVTWVVRTLWQLMWKPSTTENRKTENRIEVEDFWRNALPREYGKDVSVNKLEAGTYELYVEGGEEMIRWNGESEVVPAAHLTAAKPGKRKWHEQFRDSRNVKT